MAREVARACEQPHEVIRVEQDFLSQFPHYAERAVYLTDGCVDVSRAPDLYLNEKAREIAPVRMTGLYGGEVLRGVRAFKPEEPLPGLFAPGVSLPCPPSQRNLRWATSAGTRSPLPSSSRGRGITTGILALEQTQYSVRTPFLDNDLVRTVFRAPESALAGTGGFPAVDCRWEPGSSADSDGPRPGGRTRSLPTGGLPRFLEFLFKAEYAYDMGMPQWVAADRPRSFASAPRTSLPRETQDLPFSDLVPGCPRRVCSGNVARPAQSFQALYRTKSGSKP